MSDSRRPRGYQGEEWWGKRPVRNVCKHDKWTHFWKRRLHKIERRQGKAAAVAALGEDNP